MVWGGGLFAVWGILDFAGGIVVHITAGFAALASVFFVGARKERKHMPNNIPLVAVGTALLWFGWYGFNAGSEMAVNDVTVAAFLNTDISASFAAVTWLIIEWNTGKKKPTFIGLMTGAVAGLATITPAAGYVTIQSAALIGIVAGIGCYFAVKFKEKQDWDDALDVWGIHGMGGLIGTLLLGFFATKTINPNGADGLFYGGSISFLLKQTGAIIITVVYSLFFTLFLLRGINWLIPVKASLREEREGLDIHYHGETARDIA
jgi:Amt family ammonium transporter